MTAQTLNSRQTLLWGLLDFAQGRGLEIGPLHQRAVPKEHADVGYLDVFDRDALVAHYADDAGVPGEAIPEIDYVLFDEGRVRSIAETIGETEKFDWVMASHVIEHVPDVIGWLEDISRIVVDGGALVLAIPDRRYCFDLHRPGTSVGQMLQAHELGETVPSVRAVYDYKRGHASVRAPMVWSGNPVGYQNRIFPLDVVRSLVDRARAGEYIDSHVWLFTPGSFLEQIIELRLLHLAEWRVERLVPTGHDQMEFHAVLRRLPRGHAWDEGRLAAELAAEPVPGSMPDWLAESAERVREVTTAHAQIATLEAEVAELRSRLAQSWFLRATNGRDPRTALARRARRAPAVRTARRLLRRVPGARAARRTLRRS